MSQIASSLGFAASKSDNLGSPESLVRLAERDTQIVFSAVLESVGRDGYASAPDLEPETSMVEAIGASWENWFNQASTKRYSFVAGSESPSVRENKTSDDLRADYKAILVDAYERGGYANPNTYLQTLSRDQLSAIQQVHALADPIQVHSLSEESALNLLLPPESQVDENGDGVTQVGAATTLRFPDSRTPEKVRLAWEATTQGMSEEDLMLHELQMVMPLFTANMHFDSNGQFLYSRQPGDADWVNPMSEQDFSFQQNASDWLAYLESFKSSIPAEQYQRDVQFWSEFRDQLQRFEA